MKAARVAPLLLALFVLSGFAGLIYQSVWTQYLGLTLGHAAYAQTLVLAIFMGGMAVGAWLASHYSHRWKQLILGYAVIELVIGVLGLVFHPLFVAYSDVSQTAVLPMLSSVPLAHGYQWLSAALMITPQSILLGATFPLMSAGLIRALPTEQGQVLGGLYFTNSLGAAIGALLATFLLLPALGLPGTVAAAGVVNILVAAGAWLLSRMLDERGNAPLAGAVEGATGTSDVGRLGRVLVWSTAVSGAASFIYEIGWVRLLNQVFGTTIHSFELMLAAFILGLAFGGLWVRRRAASITAPVRYVAYVQIWMAVAALLSIPVFSQSFHWVGWIMSALSRDASGYTLYELATAAISLLVMFPAAFLAGMTLPLFTVALLRAGAGERAIGRIYAANTLGAIAGVAVMLHVLVPLMGLWLAITLGALLDGLVGVYLLRFAGERLRRPGRRAVLVVTSLGLALMISLMLGRPNPHQQIAGVFRTGVAEYGDTRIHYLKDGKTATIAVFERGGGMSISTNGKPDAAIRAFDDAPSSDEVTMAMLGSLPLALHPAPERIAVIGWGSGMTTHTLLGSTVPDVVDTIEIEAAMIEGARFYGASVARAYDDPRSHVHIDDARTFFSTGARRYDVIVSEPSNPWVSGVASLFTREFYAFLSRHLEDDGVLVQWLHTYEINDALVATMLAALLEEFPYADIYLTNAADLVVVARHHEADRDPGPVAGAGDALRAELLRLGVDTPEQMRLRRIGTERTLRAFVAMQGATPHSDYYPTVSLQAPRARFMQQHSELLQQLVLNGMPVLDLLDCRMPPGRDAGLARVEASPFSRAHHLAQRAIDTFDPAVPLGPVRDQSVGVANQARLLRSSSADLAGDPAALAAWSSALAAMAEATIGHLPPADLAAVWQTPTWLPAEAAADPVVASVLRAYGAAAARDPDAMLASAVTVLESEDPRLVPALREHMLMIAMLGALGAQQAEQAISLHARWQGQLDGGDHVPVFRFLLAWARSGQPTCVGSAG